MRKLRSIAMLLLAAFLLTDGSSAQSTEEEYRVKAAFLFHFAQLTDWPPYTVTGVTPPFVICTVEDDPFQGALETTLAGKAIGMRVISILHLKRGETMTACQIVFLGKEQGKRIPMILAILSNTPVLTIGETADFLVEGGMIRFLLQENNVRFEINLDAARSAKLAISSRLLMLARNIQQETRKPVTHDIQ